MDGRIDGWMNGRIDGWMVGLINGWINGWMVGWINGWMVGLMDGCEERTNWWGNLGLYSLVTSGAGIRPQGDEANRAMAMTIIDIHEPLILVLHGGIMVSLITRLMTSCG